MLAGYLEEGMHETAGDLRPLLPRPLPSRGATPSSPAWSRPCDYLQELRFTDEELAYLQSLGIFKPTFLAFLKDFRFRGRVIAPPRGDGGLSPTSRC